MAQEATAEKPEEKDILLRGVPLPLKRNLEAIATRQRRTLNQQVLVLLEDAVQRETAAA